jgi:hypothetical protein
MHRQAISSNGGIKLLCSHNDVTEDAFRQPQAQEVDHLRGRPGSLDAALGGFRLWHLITRANRDPQSHCLHWDT